MEYTKGEWMIQYRGKADEYALYSVFNNKKVVCEISPQESNDEAQANAQLIVSAPDLYEALRGILPELKEYVQEVGDCDHSVGICFCGLFNKIDNIELALAKAEGVNK